MNYINYNVKYYVRGLLTDDRCDDVLVEELGGARYYVGTYRCYLNNIPPNTIQLITKNLPVVDLGRIRAS